MSDERRAPRPVGGDDHLLRSLRDLGTGYDPDLTTINRRLAAGRTVGRRHRLGSAPPHIPPAIRQIQALVVPAAAVLLVIGGIIMVVSHGNPNLGWTHPPIVPIAADPSPTMNPITPEDPVGSDNSAEISADVLSGAATRAVGLDTDSWRDWVAVGSRSDLKQVRAKGRASAPLITVDQPGTAASTSGPFRVSWTAGRPEQDHEDAADWLKVTGPDALTVAVKASGRTRTVVLYAGTGPVRARLSIDGPGIAADRTLIGSASSSSTPRGVIVTVQVPPSTGAVRLKLGPTAADPNAEVYLAAVAVR